MHLQSWRPAAVTALLLAYAALAPAQSATGSVQGVIRSQGQKPLAGALVLLRNIDTRGTFTQLTAPAGKFSFSGLPAGTYEVVVSSPGMKFEKGARVVVVAGRTTLAKFKMD